MVETEEALKVEVSEVCRFYYLQVWNKAFDRPGNEASSAVRRAENVLPFSHPRHGLQGWLSLQGGRWRQGKPNQSSSHNQHLLRGGRVIWGCWEGSRPYQGSGPGCPLPLDAPKEPSKEKKASQNMEIVLVTLPIPSKEDLKGKGPASTTTASTQTLKTQKDKLVIKMKP